MDILTKSRQKVRLFYAEHFADKIDEDGFLNAPVTYDGSWPKWGFKSKIGFGSTIDTRTGFVIDFEVLSMHCQVCATAGEDADEEWKAVHASVCTKHYEGTSGGMEMQAALNLLKRSLLHGMRYTMVGDGDTKAYAAIYKDRLYGDIEVIKEECVNHVSKRLNTRLRNLESGLEEMRKAV